jgi:hypothetical protein
MKRLNAGLRKDPEFAAQFAADRAARMKIINAKHSRRMPDELQERAVAKQRIIEEKRRIDETYAYECPEGKWTGRLEETSWRNSTELLLCFADVATGRRYQIRRLIGSHYMPTDRSHDFHHDAAAGDVFELTIKRTVNGYPDLKSARKITSLMAPPKPRFIVTVLPTRRRVRRQSDQP